MSFAPTEVDHIFETNLAEARSELMPDGALRPIVTSEDGVVGMHPTDKKLIRLARKAASDLTRRIVGEAAWRAYRTWQTELGAPEFRDGPNGLEMWRTSGSGANRVDIVDQRNSADEI